MDNFECIECHFSHSILTRVNLNYSRFSHTFHLSKTRLLFNSANFSYSHMYFALFRSINFTQSDWSHVQASHIGIYNSIFTNVNMYKSLLSNSIVLFKIQLLNLWISTKQISVMLNFSMSHLLIPICT